MDTQGGLIGSVLEGRYRVGAQIARGGMSTVYRGTDLRLDRPVAIKVMNPSFAADPSFLTRFEREARLAAGLAHRGVVGVYDQGRDQDVVFLVMELVDGGTLRDLIRQSGALSVSVTMSILEPLLSALGAAHEAGLVHRDVKPENVLISSKGEVKVADFGLVRAVSSQTMATGDVILGTVAYLSPEQVATGASDPRSDVYSAGIVAFEMLTGHTPYGGDNPMSVAYQHVHSDVPPVTDQAPGVPLELDDLILAATRRDPMARPRDASAFLSAVVALRARLGLARAVVPVPRPVTAPQGRTARADGTTVHGAVVTRPRAAAPQPTLAGPTVAARPTVARPTVAAEPARSRPGAVPPPVSVPAKHSSPLRRWLLVALVVVLLGAAAAVGGWWLGSGRWAYTPAAVGIDQQSAENLVRQAGLVPHVSTEPSDSVAQGTVAGSEPQPGSRLLKGSDVELVVSTGKPTVPPVTPGSTVDQAVQIIVAAHLTPVAEPAVEQYDGAVRPGAVLSTDPPAGTPLPISADVVIVRSKGPPPVAVPAVAGKSVDDAQNKLLVAGFGLGPDKSTFAADADNGAVVGSDPAAGQLITQGSPVSLLIATSVTVPAVRGESGSQAATDLQRAGFTVTLGDAAFDADIDAGSAVGTTPIAGIRVDPVLPIVVLTLSNAAVVPDLTQGNVGAARQQLTDLGLVLDVTALFGSSGASVTSQYPGAGSRVAPGSTVRVSAFP